MGRSSRCGDLKLLIEGVIKEDYQRHGLSYQRCVAFGVPDTGMKCWPPVVYLMLIKEYVVRWSRCIQNLSVLEFCIHVGEFGKRLWGLRRVWTCFWGEKDVKSEKGGGRRAGSVLIRHHMCEVASIYHVDLTHASVAPDPRIGSSMNFNISSLLMSLVSFFSLSLLGYNVWPTQNKYNSIANGIPRTWLQSLQAW